MNTLSTVSKKPITKPGRRRKEKETELAFLS